VSHLARGVVQADECARVFWSSLMFRVFVCSQRRPGSAVAPAPPAAPAAPRGGDGD